MPSAGHLIVKQLEAQGVPRVYLVPGESYLDVLDGLYDASIESIVCRQEGGAGFMALAEGRLTSLPGVCMVTRGPGAANALIAVHTAFQDATPLVLFVGLIPHPDHGHEAFQEFSLDSWFGSTAKRVYTIDNPDHAANIVRDAFHVASSGRPGPVVIGLPEDVLVRETNADTLTPWQLPSQGLSPTVTEALRERFAASAKPLIYAGGDGWTQEASAELAKWATEAGVPVALEWRASDAIDHASPCYAGWLGYGRANTLAERLNETDLIVCIGATLGDVNTDGFSKTGHCPTVLITRDSELTQHYGRADLVVVSNQAEAVAGLPDATASRGDRDDSWMEALAADERRYGTPGSDGTFPVDHGAAFATLSEHLPADTIVTLGAGNATLWAQRYLHSNRPQCLVGPRNGAMGVAIPAAVAATAIFPERRVVAVCGDGDFLMNAQELAAEHVADSNLLVIVVDNGIYGTIVQHQQGHYPGRPSGTAMKNPDFAGYMKAFGGHGELVTTTEEFGPALERALNAPGAALLQLRLDPSCMVPVGDNSER